MKHLLLLSLLLLISTISLFGQQKREYTLIMRNSGSYTLWDGRTVLTYGFAEKLNQQPPIPGPVIYADEGDTVVITARNVSQGAPHTIHLHGLDVDQANDGVGHLSFHIHHMEEGTYTFIATHAGTYLYHCHVASVIHVQMGMYGLVIVRAANGEKRAWTGGPSFDKEYAWLMSEMDSYWHDNVPDHDSDHSNVNIPPYNPDYFLINGKAKHQLQDSAIALSGKVKEKIYLRLANVGFHMNRVIIPSFMSAIIIDSDGRPLPQQIATDTVEFTSGERYGIMLAASGEGVDSIEVQFVNVNNNQVLAREYVPITIKGHVGIKQATQQNFIQFYPNPAEDILFFRSDKSLFTLVDIFDITGRKIISTHMNLAKNVPFQLPVSEFNPGIYIINFITDSGVIRKRFIKK